MRQKLSEVSETAIWRSLQMACTSSEAAGQVKQAKKLTMKASVAFHCKLSLVTIKKRKEKKKYPRAQNTSISQAPFVIVGSGHWWYT